LNLRELTPREEAVILRKGTEPAFAGRYVKHDAQGIYECKRCGAALFRSEDKFDSGSGWPSFDQALPGAVKEIPDADGRRTEIVCARCGAHLGHVFRGERMTPRNTRHCVNSISLDFEPAKPTSDENRPARGDGQKIEQ
jgi:methionine-R-sulfoxide reductase